MQKRSGLPCRSFNRFELSLSILPPKRLRLLKRWSGWSLDERDCYHFRRQLGVVFCLAVRGGRRGRRRRRAVAARLRHGVFRDRVSSRLYLPEQPSEVSSLSAFHLPGSRGSAVLRPPRPVQLEEGQPRPRRQRPQHRAVSSGPLGVPRRQRPRARRTAWIRGPRPRDLGAHARRPVHTHGALESREVLRPAFPPVPHRRRAPLRPNRDGQPGDQPRVKLYLRWGVALEQLVSPHRVPVLHLLRPRAPETGSVQAWAGRRKQRPDWAFVS